MASATLQQAVINLEKAIQDLTLNPRPNYSVGGRSYSWDSLLSMLIQQHKTLLVAVQDSDGPFYTVSAGVTSAVDSTDGYFPPTG